MSDTRADNEIRRLNTLRGLAALIVLASHYSNDTLLMGGVLGYGAGQFGVMLFFTLSGFLMAYLYGQQTLDRASVRRFCIARFARVLPLFLAVVVISYALQKAGADDIFFKIKTAKFLLAHLLLLNGTDILWTIPPEIHFYLLFVGLWWLGKRQPAVLYALMAITVMALYWWDFPAFRFRLLGLPVHLTLFWSLPYFFVGILFGRLYRRWSAPEWLRSHWFALSLLLLPLAFPKILAMYSDFSYLFWKDLSPILLVALVFFSVVFMVPAGNILLENRAGDFLGKVSYSLYLLHVPVLKLLVPDSASAHPWLWLGLYLCCALLVSYGSYRLVEKPCRDFIRSRGGIAR